jgi:hypothetical protein
MLIALAGRMARAYVAESPGVYQPSWTIDDVAENLSAIRATSSPLVFSPVPTGHMDHLRYSFGLAAKER